MVKEGEVSRYCTKDDLISSSIDINRDPDYIGFNY